MEKESFNTKNSSLNQNNKYIEYINKNDNPEKLQNQIINNIKVDIINQLNLKLDNINKNFNDKLEEIKKYIDEAMKIQLKNILTHINKNNDNENLNKNNNNQKIIFKVNEDNKGIKNETKYKKLNLYNCQTNYNYGNFNNKNKEKNIIVNDFKNNDIKNSNLFFLNQNNIIKRKDNNINKEDLNPKYNEEKIFKKKIHLENENPEKNENKTNNFIRINNNFYNNKPKNLKISEISSNNNRNINDMNKIGEDSKFKTFNSEAKENKESKLYQSINNIFFYDYQQKYIKYQKINEYQKDELKKEILNDKIKEKNILKKYYMNYIEKIILPLFRRNKNIIQSKLDIIKYNISIILECLGMDKHYYNAYYYQNETNKKKPERSQSHEALLRFRKEFEINKEDVTDNALENRLIENDLDIFKTFRKIYG